MLRTVVAHVPYLAASTRIHNDERDWVACDVLVNEPSKLAAIVRGTAAGFGTDDDAVAASLFTEAYAFRVAGAALAAFSLDLPVPAVGPAAVAVRIDNPRPSAVAYLSNTVSTPHATALASALVDTHFRPFIAAVHREFQLGERNLWGNVAAACAVAFRAVESSGADRSAVRARADAFFDACGPTFAGLGAFTVVGKGGYDGWYWDRASCCLWFRTTDSSFCDNCSLLERTELDDRRVREVAEPGEPD